MSIRIETVSTTFAQVFDGDRHLGDVQRDSVAFYAAPGRPSTRTGWAAIPPRMVSFADPVNQAGATLFDTMEQAAESLAR